MKLKKFILLFFALITGFSLSAFATYWEFQYVSSSIPQVSLFAPLTYGFNFCNNTNSYGGGDWTSCDDNSSYLGNFPLLSFGLTYGGNRAIYRDYLSNGLDKFDGIKSDSASITPTLIDRTYQYDYSSFISYLSRPSYRIFLQDQFSNNSTYKGLAYGIGEFFSGINYYGVYGNTTIISNMNSTLGNGYSVWYAPGFSFTTFDCNSDINGGGQCATDFDTKYYEIDSNLFNNDTYNIYPGLFVSYISNQDTTLSTGLYNNGINNKFSTFVGVHSGTDLYFSVYDCYSPSLAYVRDSCSVIEYGFFTLGQLNHYQFTYTNNSVNGYAGQAVGQFFTDIDTGANYIYSDASVGNRHASVYSHIDYTTSVLDGNTYNENPIYNGTGGFIGGSGTNSTGSNGSGINFSGNVILQDFSGNNTNIFGGVTVNGTMFFQCSTEFSTNSLSLKFSDIPVISTIYDLSSLIGIGLPDVNIFGPISCPYGAYLYGRQNIIQSVVLPQGTGMLTLTQSQNDYWIAFINFMISIPALYFSYRILKG